MRKPALLSLLLALPAAALANGPVLDQAQNCAQNSDLCFGASNTVTVPAGNGSTTAAPKAETTSSMRSTDKPGKDVPTPEAKDAKPGMMSGVTGFLSDHKDTIVTGAAVIAGAGLGYWAAAALVLGPPLAGAVIGIVLGMMIAPMILKLFK